jgi:alpha-L-fucosidase
MFRIDSDITEAEYVQLPAKFNPTGFDADEWVRIAKDAGMRYVVITSKHHDGFCMFEAPGTDYRITNTAFGRDVCKELSVACEKADMPLGFYYSPPDMHHPGYRDVSKPATSNWTGEPKRKEWATYLDYMESHLRKLLTDYGKVRMIWFDGLTNHNKYDPARFKKLIHELDPDTLINDRCGDDYDFITPEQFIPKGGVPVRTGKPPAGVDPGGDGFFRTVCALYKVPGIRGWLKKQMEKYAAGSLDLTALPQAPYPSPERYQLWETCMTIGGSWAYNPKETEWKSAGLLIRNLSSVASRGGNYLLDVGPTGLGTFPAESVERLARIGRWLSVNGEAVYGTTYAPTQSLPWGRTTRKGDTLYLHVFDWPADGRLVLPEVPGTVTDARLLTGEPLRLVTEGEGLAVHLPATAPDPDVSVIALEFAPDAPGWTRYDERISGGKPASRHLRSQIINSAWINALINGLLAYFTYRGRADLPYLEAAVDILITVAIISFLTAWLNVGDTRTKLEKNTLAQPLRAGRRWLLPHGPALRGLVLMVVCTALLGGVVLDGSLFLFGVTVVPHDAYIALKTLYTGAAGALAAALAVLSVYREGKRPD